MRGRISRLEVWGEVNTATIATAAVIALAPSASAANADTAVKVSMGETSCSGSIISPSWALVTGACVSANPSITYTVTTQGDVPVEFLGTVTRDYNYPVALVHLDGVYEGSIEPLTVSDREMGAWIGDVTGYRITGYGPVDDGPSRGGLIRFLSSLWSKITS